MKEKIIIIILLCLFLISCQNKYETNYIKSEITQDVLPSCPKNQMLVGINSTDIICEETVFVELIKNVKVGIPKSQINNKKYVE